MGRLVVVGGDVVLFERAGNVVAPAVDCGLYDMRRAFAVNLYDKLAEVGLYRLHAVLFEERVQLYFLRRHRFYFDDVLCVLFAEYVEDDIARFVRVFCEENFNSVALERCDRRFEILRRFLPASGYAALRVFSRATVLPTLASVTAFFTIGSRFSQNLSIGCIAIMRFLRFRLRARRPARRGARGMRCCSCRLFPFDGAGRTCRRRRAHRG